MQFHPHHCFELRQLHHILCLRIVQLPLVVEQVHPAVEEGQEIHLVDPVADDRRLQGLLGLGDDTSLVEQSLESAVIGYRVSKVDFLTLLDGRMTLFNYERELYESQAEYMMKLAQLEAAVGVELH